VSLVRSRWLIREFSADAPARLFCFRMPAPVPRTASVRLESETTFEHGVVADLAAYIGRFARA
jgi:hypothetical protein